MRKWIQTIKTFLSSRMAYRLDFFLIFIGPTIIFYLIQVALWSSIFHWHSEDSIQGLTLSSMLNYHLWAMIVALMAKRHVTAQMAMDIRLGRISSYLIYPFNFWEFHTASFLAFQAIQVCIALATVGMAWALGILHTLALEPFLKGLGVCFFVSFFWFSIQYFIGLLAFWLEETWVMRALFGIIATFLSGGIIPMELFPPWLSQALMKTPFPYLTYFPIKVFQGEVQHISEGISQILLWAILLWAVNTILWKRGLRLYSGAGM